MDGEPASIGLCVEDLTVEFDGRLVLDRIRLTVPDGQVLAVNGPSGCGKTTLLRAVAGLLPVATGSIQLGGTQIAHMAAHRRGVVYLSQEPLLFPHLSVFDNVAFGLRLRHARRSDLHARVGDMLAQLELKDLEMRHPDQLSGGQKQRVAFGRALIVGPPLLLLDEPFSSLDPETRKAMQGLFRKIAAQRRITALFVTHDLRETLTVGDRLGVLRGGHLQTYRDRATFGHDPATGVANEAAFWRDVLETRTGMAPAAP